MRGWYSREADVVFLFKRHLTASISRHLQNLFFVTAAMLNSPCCKGEGSISDSLLEVIRPLQMFLLKTGSEDHRRSAYFNHYLPS